MDPNANIKEQLDLSLEIIRRMDDPNRDPREPVISDDDANRLAELVIALHEWRVGGGYDPYAR